MASHRWEATWKLKRPVPVRHWCQNRVSVSTGSVEIIQTHAWQQGYVFGHSPGDLPDGQLGVEIPGHVLGGRPDLHPDTMPLTDPTAAPEHAHCNVSKGIPNCKS